MNTFCSPAYLFSSGRSQFGLGSGRVWFHRAKAAARPAEARETVGAVSSSEADTEERRQLSDRERPGSIICICHQRGPARSMIISVLGTDR